MPNARWPSNTRYISKSLFVVFTTTVSEESHKIVETQFRLVYLVTTERCGCEFALLLLQREDTLLHSLLNGQLIDIDLTCLAEAMSSIERLIL